MSAFRHVKLFKNGRNQAIRVPREFELRGEDAIIRREGDKLVIKAAPAPSLLAVLADLSPIDEDFPQIDIQPFDVPADATYADLRVRLEAAGTPIGGNDMLIAAHALATECAVVTDDEREFAGVADPRVENWLR